MRTGGAAVVTACGGADRRGGGRRLGVDVSPTRRTRSLSRFPRSRLLATQRRRAPTDDEHRPGPHVGGEHCVVPSDFTRAQASAIPESFGWLFHAAALRKVCRSWGQRAADGRQMPGRRMAPNCENGRRGASAAQDAAAVVNPAALREDPRGCRRRSSPLRCSRITSAKVVPGMSMALGSHLDRHSSCERFTRSDVRDIVCRKALRECSRTLRWRSAFPNAAKAERVGWQHILFLVPARRAVGLISSTVEFVVPLPSCRVRYKCCERCL